MKRPQTIAQFAIRRWLEANFYISTLTVEFLSGNTAKIEDHIGYTALVVCSDEGIYLEDLETPAAGTAGESGN